jgi:hypothetical protein
VKLLSTTKQNISLHIQNVFKSRELEENPVVKDFLTTAEDGKSYNTKHYNTTKDDFENWLLDNLKNQNNHSKDGEKEQKERIFGLNNKRI